MAYRIAVDIGGTFTDFVVIDDSTGEALVHKQLTTPDDPSIAVIEGVELLLRKNDILPMQLSAIIHGTTLVNNAIIQRKGGRAGMLVTEGFRDVLDIGRERRYDLFDLRLVFPKPVIPRRWRIAVNERITFDGAVRNVLNCEGLEAEIQRLVHEERIEAMAICLLHSYVNPEHENQLASWVTAKFPDLAVSVSNDIFPFMREFERWTTTTLNAYVQPVVDRYLTRLERGLSALGFTGRFSIMTSSGGNFTGDIARRYPIRLLESGPAAGALMSAEHGRNLGIENLLSFDMGGTTAKGCLIRHGTPLKKYDYEVAREHEFMRGSGLPVSIPVIDMIEIGAGGGSLAEPDARGVLRVGPQSAGAHPGPACYELGGTQPALTDANVVLGYLDPDYFMGGQMRISREAASDAILNRLGKSLGTDVLKAAWGIHEVVNEDVARAFRVHAAERGIDYRRSSMVAFGGSGPIHALRIAHKLRIPKVICPAGAGVMSAFGLLISAPSFEVVRSNRIALETLTEEGFCEIFLELEKQTRDFLLASQAASSQIRIFYRLDMRYQGQGYEVEVSFDDMPLAGIYACMDARFREEYRKIFSVAFEGKPVEIVAWKVEAKAPAPEMAESMRLRDIVPSAQALKGSRPAYCVESGAMRAFDVYDRYLLAPGSRIAGPALVEEKESTFVLGSRDRAEIDHQFNLIANVGVV